MSTQTEVLEMLAPLQVPPRVRVIITIFAPPRNKLSVMVVADAVGTAASVAAMTNAKSESLKLLSHTTVPPLGSYVGSTSGNCRSPTKIVQTSFGSHTASTVIRVGHHTRRCYNSRAENLFLLGVSIWAENGRGCEGP